ncbi:TPA: hypothetical protein OT951_003675 [Pseudomonas aeruginosa]|nr:hypothetical protein [Pseudomonas aeruginosa]
MNHHFKRIMLYTKRTLLGAMVAILIVFKAIDLGGANWRSHRRATSYAPVRSRPVIRITAASPAGGGRHEENTRSSGF